MAPSSHTFDEQSYLRDRPAVRALVEDERVPSAYAHLLANGSEDELARYTGSTPPPTVSIVVPCHQSQDWLAHTLDSVRKQTYRAWECIVVDDFSSDKTARVIQRYVAKDRRFKLVSHRANGGPNAARNSGIRSARAGYICFLDSDDLLMPTSIGNRLRAIAAIDDARLAGSYSGSQTITERLSQPPPEVHANGMTPLDFISVGGRCPFNANQPMFKTDVVRLLGGFDETIRLAEDWEFWMRILRHGYYMVPTHKVDVTYRARAGSGVRTDPLSHLETALSVYDAAHAPLPADQVYPGTPFVFTKPWIEYKRQLDISERVLEFSGMAMSDGDGSGRAIDIAAQALPDFFGALQPRLDSQGDRRAAADAVHTGAKRQKAGPKDDASRGASDALTEKYLQDWRALAGTSASPTSPDTSRWDIDVVFLPHKDYHVWTMALLIDALREANISYTFVDLTVIYRDEGARAKLDELALPRISYNEFVLGNYSPKLVVCMNDWDPINRSIVRGCQSLGIPTVGIVEGVQDYRDADTRKVRAPYQTVDYVLLPGQFDARYFSDAGSDRVRVGGVPRIDELLAQTNTFPERPLVIINSNFTYNVLTQHRDAWLRDAVSACASLGYDYAISRHPADDGDFSAYKVGAESMYDLIGRGSVFVSRFGSGILESLAMGKPAVYFNPHAEKVDKFTEPNGAFPISTSRSELIEALRSTVETPERYLSHAADYVDLHCGARVGHSASQKLAAELIDIYRTASVPDSAMRARLGLVLVHGDERLLGKLTTGAGDLDAAPDTSPFSVRTRLADLGNHNLEGRLQGLQKKVRKLRRDPRAFFRDSRSKSVSLLRHLFRS